MTPDVTKIPEESSETFVAPMTPDEILFVLSRAPNTVPGKDKATYAALKATDPRGTVLCRILTTATKVEKWNDCGMIGMIVERSKLHSFVRKVTKMI